MADKEKERLSVVLTDTRDMVFREEELIEHLEPVAAAEDDLPSSKRG